MGSLEMFHREAPSKVGPQPCQPPSSKGLCLGAPIRRVHLCSGVDGAVVETDPEECFGKNNVSVASMREPQGCRMMGGTGGDSPTYHLTWQNLGSPAHGGVTERSGKK